jgi:prepilin-type N-terminal cleavage/methylation domain-containing protein
MKTNHTPERWRDRGFSMVEILVVGAIISILTLIGVPNLRCHIQKTKLQTAMNDLVDARDRVELFEMEMGHWPATLEQAYGNMKPPETVVYCTENNDGDAGHGNELCTFFDSDNPSGQNNHGGMPALGFFVRTNEGIGAPCVGISFAWLACCGAEPVEVGTDEDPNLGHPGNPQSG